MYLRHGRQLLRQAGVLERFLARGMAQMKFCVDGLTVAPVTPYNQSGEIAFNDFKRCVQFYKESHFKYLFVNGTLGEGNSQSVTERKRGAEKWLEVTDGSMSVILHVGTGNLRDTQELARHAQDIGVAAIAALSPNYHKPATEEALVEYVESVTSAAPETPFLYYDYNIATGIYLNVPRFLRLAEKRVPTLYGLKHTSPELSSALNCSTVCGGKFHTLFGTEVLYLPALSLGLRHVITTPHMGQLFYDIRTAYDAGDMESALRHQTRAQELFNIMSDAGGGIGCARWVFRLMSGIKVGPPRLPLQDLTRDQKALLEQTLSKEGFI